MASMDREFLAEIRAALAAAGVRDCRLAILSLPGFGRKGGRLSCRVDVAGGSVLKARRLESRAEAARLVEIRAPLDRSFAPVIGRHESVLLEEWIEGATVTPEVAAERAEEVGALLGLLHAAVPAGESAPVSTGERLERVMRQLVELESAGAVSAGQANALRAALVEHDPGTAPRAVVHLDYCPENLVVDRQGRLHSIDNEWMRIDCPGVDLGRTYGRWPMPEDVWRRVLRGYETSSPFAADGLVFWQIAMAVAGAGLRLRRSAEDLSQPLERLRRLAAPGRARGSRR